MFIYMRWYLHTVFLIGLFADSTMWLRSIKVHIGPRRLTARSKRQSYQHVVECLQIVKHKDDSEVVLGRYMSNFRNSSEDEGLSHPQDICLETQLPRNPCRCQGMSENQSQNWLFYNFSCTYFRVIALKARDEASSRLIIKAKQDIMKISS